MPATRRSQSHHDSTVGNATVKKITVFRNGDAVHGSIQMVVNNRQIRDMNILLENISQRIGLINGAKKLYTTSGVLIKSIGDLQDGHSYVASSNHYTPLPYGGVNKKSKKPKIHKEEENHQPLVDEETQTKKKKKKIHKKEVEAVEKLEKQEKPGKLKKKKARSSSRKAEEKKKSEIEDDVISERDLGSDTLAAKAELKL
ncbi:unnamed protein product [Caenorhabditis auriculariae]|uniref:Doublecortin domain-containing protein n=1 Tax=Caenorhabditis auriculariae TaxID=2777116 RepID=A0A8S1HS04_9PELO|nr:unnamed protein product [Caenorhabditis auriculariae]